MLHNSLDQTKYCTRCSYVISLFIYIRSILICYLFLDVVIGEPTIPITVYILGYQFVPCTARRISQYCCTPVVVTNDVTCRHFEVRTPKTIRARLVRMSEKVLCVS